MLPDETEPVLPEGKLDPDLLAGLLALLPAPGTGVLVRPALGEDAAVVLSDAEAVVLTTDPITFVSGAAADWLVQVNANDIAAMGARPRYLTVAAMFPAGSSTAGQVRRLFENLLEACRRMSVDLIGGHTEVTRAVNQPLLVGQMTGFADQAHIHRSRDAQPGDRIILAGWAAREGSAILAARREADLAAQLSPDRLREIAGWARPPGLSIVEAALTLAPLEGVHALHDATESGLAGALGEVARASGLGCVLAPERVPIQADTLAICAHLGLDWLGLISSGLLVATVAPAAAPACLAALAEVGLPAADAGEIIRGDCLMSVGGRRLPLPRFPVDELTKVL